jgi:hypothetical protein
MKPMCVFAAVVLTAAEAGLDAHAEPLGQSSRRTGWVISELMPQPAPRPDGKNLEFIELYNAEVFPEDLSGHRLTGEVDFTFPANTVVPAGGFVVVAPNPADLQSIHGLTGVFGGFTNRLANAGGTVRLLNPAGAVLLEVNYSTQPPGPAAAAGAGHSLILWRPSRGEGDAHAWAASALFGGSPGGAEPAREHPWQNLVINEFLAHTEAPQTDFIELYNHGNSAVDLSGCGLTDDPTTNRFTLPPGTLIPARGVLAFEQATLGFALNAAGETIYLRGADGLRVIDAVAFGPQVKGVATGRTPDGAPLLSHLRQPTPGAANAVRLQPDVVINELMFNPLSGDDDDEFIELHNRGAQPVALAGWRLEAGVAFTLPADTVLPADGYLVIARNAAQLRAHYPNLTVTNCVGDYAGSLRNRGERLALTRPETVLTTNASGGVITQVRALLVNEVTYGEGGRWGRWADGGGSSLELTDARADNRLARNWADSDESAKAPWTTLEVNGTLDHGVGAVDQLQVFLQAAGACLLDDVEVRGAGTVNLVANATFATGSTGWTAQGTQEQSAWDAATQTLRIEAVGRGDTGANRLHTALASGLNPGATGTIRARARWLRGRPDLLLRLRGNYLECVGRLTVPANLGTPGARNSRAVANAAPVVAEVTTAPVLPAAGTAVTVTARVDDPDGIASVELRYRLDPATQFSVVGMSDDGTGADAVAQDGLYSATLPGQASGRLVAYHVVARDAAAASATGSYPDAAPAVEALIRFGETRPAGRLGTYRLWMTQATFDRWSQRSRLDNSPLTVTFVYNDQRVLHGVGAIYAGSPHISPGYNTPAGNLCGYVLNFPDDDRFLGANDVVLDWPGRDNTAQQEPFSYWLARQLGLPFNHRRHIRLHVNGVTETQRGSIYEDAQQVNSDLIASWRPETPSGDLFKIEQWFEYNDNGGLTQVGPPRLENYTTTGGAKKLARYRWSWLKRAAGEGANDYRRLFNLVEAANATDPQVYARQVDAFVDVEEWMGVFATENLVANFDSYGHDIGKNMYAYKPSDGKWQLFMWDIDWVMLPSAQQGYTPQAPLMYRGPARFGDSNRDPTIGRMYDQPGFQRAYWRAVQAAAEGPLLEARVAARLDGVYNALKANGVTMSAGSALAAPTAVKTWLAQRRTYLLAQLATVAAPFQVLTPAAGFSTDRNLATLTGTAPITVKELRVNGTGYWPTWTTVTNWSVSVPVTAGANALRIEGFDRRGAPVAGATADVGVQFTGVPDPATEALVINELMYHPAVAGAEFVELFNRSSTTAFELAEYRLDGTGFQFGRGTVLPPGGYLVVAQNREAFAEAYGVTPFVTGEYSGQLDNAGETVRLLRAGSPGSAATTVAGVSYEPFAPWPETAAGSGASLQLIDAAQDPRRVANWATAAAVSNVPPQTLVPLTATWRYEQSGLDLGTAWREPAYDDRTWPAGPALLYHESDALPGPKSTPLTLGQRTYYFRTQFNFTGDPAAVGLALTTVIDDGALVWLNGQPLLRLGVPEGDVTAATWANRTVGNAALEGPFLRPADALRRGENVLAVEVHQITDASSDLVFGLSLETVPPAVAALATPAAPNAVRATLPPLPALWLNEVTPDNLTGLTDRTGAPDPWVELFNGGTNALNLDGYYLTDSLADLSKWPFPPGTTLAPGQWLLVWLDGEPEQTGPGEWHANFRLPATNGLVALTTTLNHRPAVLDYLRYGTVGPDRSLGYAPDGHGEQRQPLPAPTPGGANVTPQPLVFINEWLAANVSSGRDPADGDFDDWFELFNAGTGAVDLSGFTLTDNVTTPRQFIVPAGTVVPAGGFLLVWADEEPAQGQPGGDLHVNFRLSQNGDQLALFTPDGTLVDQVSFGPQTANVTVGRWPDGAAGPFSKLSLNTPRTANAPPTGAGLPPVVEALTLTPEGAVRVTWRSEPGLKYRLQFKDSLAAETWNDATGDALSTGSSMTATDVPPEESGWRFYRVLLVP